MIFWGVEVLFYIYTRLLIAWHKKSIHPVVSNHLLVDFIGNTNKSK